MPRRCGSAADSYLRPIYHSPAIRQDAKRFIAGVHNRYTLAAAQQLPEFRKPVLLVRARTIGSSLPNSSTDSRQRSPTPIVDFAR